MLVSGWKWKTRKIIIPCPIPSYEALVSVKENTNKKRKKSKKERKKERKKEKNTDRTQTTLNTAHVMHNFKILSQ